MAREGGMRDEGKGGKVVGLQQQDREKIQINDEEGYSKLSIHRIVVSMCPRLKRSMLMCLIFHILRINSLP